jgi:hypothetical protein
VSRRHIANAPLQRRLLSMYSGPRLSLTRSASGTTLFSFCGRRFFSYAFYAGIPTRTRARYLLRLSHSHSRSSQRHLRVLLLPVLALAAGLEWRAWLNKRTVYKQLFWLAPLLVVACLVTFGGGIRERISGSNTSLFIGHKQYPDASLAVGNRPSNYLLFSPKQFIQLPFTDLYDDRYGRQMFWHYFWKTSLFGETNRGGQFESLCASVLRIAITLFHFGIAQSSIFP